MCLTVGGGEHAWAIASYPPYGIPAIRLLGASWTPPPPTWPTNSSIMPESTSASSTLGATRHNGASMGASLSSDRDGPTRFPYLFRNIRDFPRRIIHPPSPSVPKVGTTRSLKLKPCYQVALDDVVSGKHLPPLGRKEFEDFLYFKEYSVENLYFYVWLKQYEREYTQWANSYPSATTDVKPNAKLAMSYAKAKETFFTSGSPWELNLPQRTLQQLLHPQTSHPGPKTHPHPSALSAVRFEVENYLNDSLVRFIVQNGGNAGRWRGIFAITVGTLVIILGLLPIILTSLAHNRPFHQRLVRLASLPAIWFGFATLIAGFHGVCIVIFLFGDARQLYPYELRRPNISSPITCCPAITLNPNLAANAEDRNKKGGGVNTAYGDPASRRPNLAALALDNVVVGVSGGARQRSSVPVTISPQKERHDRTEFVQFGRPRKGTVTASEASVEGHQNIDHKHAESVSNTDYESVGPLDFGLYDEGGLDTPKTIGGGYAEERDVKESSVDESVTVQMFPTNNSNRNAPTPITATYTTPLYPESPIVFDFDALPVPPTMRVPDWKLDALSPTTTSGSTAVPLWQQGVPASTLPYGTPSGYGSSTSTNVRTKSATSGSALRSRINAVKDWEWNKERTMFSPLTKVFDPIVTRTQWEIVMRSCVVALVISIIISLASLGLP